MSEEVPEGQPSAQPPPGWPYGDGPPAAAGGPAAPAAGTPRKRRRPRPRPQPAPPPPSRAWWLVGVGLIVLAVVSMIAFIILAVVEGVSVFKDGTQFDSPGQAQVDLPPGEERMLWSRPGAEPDCSVADTSGSALPLDESVSVSVSINDDEWVGVGTFPTGNGHVIVTCHGTPGPVRIGQVFGGFSFVAKILAAVFTPIILGFAGAAVLGITGVRQHRSRG